MGRRAVLTATFDAGAHAGGTAPGFYDYTLGGPFRLSALPRNALRGPKYALATAGYRLKVGSLPKLFGGAIYATLSAEAGSVFDRASRMRVKSAVTGGFAAETALGPVFAGISGGSGDAQVYFLIGRQVR